MRLCVKHAMKIMISVISFITTKQSRHSKFACLLRSHQLLHLVHLLKHLLLHHFHGLCQITDLLSRLLSRHLTTQSVRSATLRCSLSS